MSFSLIHNNHTNNTYGSLKMITMFFVPDANINGGAHKSTALPVKPGRNIGLHRLRRPSQRAQRKKFINFSQARSRT